MLKDLICLANKVYNGTLNIHYGNVIHKYYLGAFNPCPSVAFEIEKPRSIVVDILKGTCMSHVLNRRLREKRIGKCALYKQQFECALLFINRSSDNYYMWQLKLISTPQKLGNNDWKGKIPEVGGACALLCVQREGGFLEKRT